MVTVSVHPSCFPDQSRKGLLESWRERRIRHKLHYQTAVQARKWLALHRRYSPWVQDPGCRRCHLECFHAVVQRLASGAVQLVGLGCGTGEKEALFLKELQTSVRRVRYSPVDGSLPLVLEACRNGATAMPAAECRPWMLDLETCPRFEEDLFAAEKENERLLVTSFGVLPNLPPAVLVPKVHPLLLAGGWWLFSANLFPEMMSEEEARAYILPQYDNPPTRQWLEVFLRDHGVNAEDGRMEFEAEGAGSGSEGARFVARFWFGREREIHVEEEVFRFREGEAIELFDSHRFRPKEVVTLFGQLGVRIVDQWITASGEEGLFLGMAKGARDESMRTGEGDVPLSP